MALDIVVQALQRVELFAGLKPLQISELARHADRIVYRPGQSIITEGEPGDGAVLIVTGDAVRLFVDTPTSPAEPVLDGSLVGELAMLIEAVHTSTVVARGPTRAIRITRAGLRQQMDEDPSVALLLSNNLAKRLDGVAEELNAIDIAIGRASRVAAAFGPVANLSMLPSLASEGPRVN